MSHMGSSNYCRSQTKPGVENLFYFHPNLISTLDPGLAAGSSLNLTLGSDSEWSLEPRS